MKTQCAPQVTHRVAPQFTSQSAHQAAFLWQNQAAPQTTRHQYMLQAAHQKLLTPDMPLMLRLVGFLRISCSLLEERGVYAKLMKALHEQDQAWWNMCQITPEGCLTSSHPGIRQLLTPVLNVYAANNT